MLDWVAEICGARVTRVEHVQTLWSGYGEIVRVFLAGDVRTAIVKHVRPPAGQTSTGDARKRRSYTNELAFYREYAPMLGERCRVAALYGSRVTANEWWFVLEDLDGAGFPLRHDHLHVHHRGAELDTCLAWLARFHARFLGVDARRLWPTGTYWHLATRMDELAAIRDASLRARAAELDAKLERAEFQTLVHGDAKEANFCFARDHRVAAVDFQYTGRGVGVRDVAYLLDGHAGLRLDTYFRYLREAIAESEASVDVRALESEWRTLYPVAHQDFQRFLAGWNPTR
ncbi:MAG: phosphotransferase [Kofleriaceae bacterium]